VAGGLELRDRGNRRANLSYLIFPRFRPRGLAVEAITLATTWALGNMGVDSVVAIINVANAAPRATVERTGFVLEGPAERSACGTARNLTSAHTDVRALRRPHRVRCPVSAAVGVAQWTGEGGGAGRAGPYGAARNNRC
jgi:hypothetical protein